MEEEPARGGIAGFIRESPETVVIMLVFIVVGAVGALWLPLGDSITTTKRVLGGAIAGFYFGLFPIGKRMFD